ncbi:hypothetical protein OMCYN_01783 [cyanobiont of Ornithocercus magnificus]|nr:hypothetical protein OMCYN_01783 [cyanobiont of Ornithocercus magnificus]
MKKRVSRRDLSINRIGLGCTSALRRFSALRSWEVLQPALAGESLKLMRQAF